MTSLSETARSDSDRYREEYDEDFVARWDRVVGWATRAKSEGTFFIDMLRGAGVTKVLDAATGTGFHSVALAEAGFDVTAVDGAPFMVEKARENLAARGLDVRCEVAGWRQIDSVVAGPFDAIVCLGNSFGHLFSEADLDAALAGFRRVLVPRGLLVLDQRNYDAILDGTAVKTKQSYCCVGDGATVTLDKLNDNRVRITYTLDGGDTVRWIETHPWRRRQIIRALEQAGFTGIETLGDYAPEFDPETVEFLVHVARSRS